MHNEKNKHRIEFTTTSDKVGHSLISFTGCQCSSNNAKKPKTLFSTKGFCSAMYKKMPRRQSAGWLPESLLLLCGICHFRFSSCHAHYMHLNTSPAAKRCCCWCIDRLADPPTEAETRGRPAATAPSSQDTSEIHKTFPNDFQPFLFHTQSKFCGQTQFLMHIYCPYALSSRKASVVQWQIVSLLLAIL